MDTCDRERERSPSPFGDVHDLWRGHLVPRLLTNVTIMRGETVQCLPVWVGTRPVRAEDVHWSRDALEVLEPRVGTSVRERPEGIRVALRFVCLPFEDFSLRSTSVWSKRCQNPMSNVCDMGDGRGVERAGMLRKVSGVEPIRSGAVRSRWEASWATKRATCGDQLPVEGSVRDRGVGGSNPLAQTSQTRSIPGTWVTDYSGDIGNTFGPNGFSIGSSLQVSSSKYPKSYCMKVTSHVRSLTCFTPTFCPANT